jgi:hypothetical protein
MMIRGQGAVFLAMLGLASLGLQAEVDFNHEVVPLLKKHCTECHAGDKKKGSFSMNTRASLLEGSENGVMLVPGQVVKSKILELLVSADPDTRMPPKGPGLSPAEVEVFKNWIKEGVVWTEGFAFKQPAYEPPLKPRSVVVPAPQAGRNHPIDCLLDDYLQRQKITPPSLADDSTYLRRVYLDLIGILPSPEETAAFLANPHPDKRAVVARELLARDVDYADHWMVFWNDLLRNDYAGTGYIDGGRKQITAWLYRSLINNKPYDVFARELIAPAPESEGFSKGIIWRGATSAGQKPEMQFAQSVGQTFLGINMKCASCHDSFTDRWKLKDSYGLAAIYSDHPLELIRCDIPTGKPATAAWIFPELGQIDATLPRAERLKQLAALMTHPDNGRFQRTMVNRLWHRLMGRGIVHPVDAMQTAPWNQDLLDLLANQLVASKYDLKAVLLFIVTSQAYQSQSEILHRDTDDKGYTYHGPRAKRMSAEEFVDAIWRLTGTAPGKIDAGVLRSRDGVATAALLAQPIWSNDTPKGQQPAANETRAFRKLFNLNAEVRRAALVITCDNAYELIVNGLKVGKGDDWQTPQTYDLSSVLKKGANEMIAVGRNGGTVPNPAGLWVQLYVQLSDDKEVVVATDKSWQWTSVLPNAQGALPAKVDWKPVTAVPDVGWTEGERRLAVQYAQLSKKTVLLPRAALMKSDLLQRSLGRPNREQIVSMRPTELSTLEAIDLANGAGLTDLLNRGAANLMRRHWATPDALVHWLYQAALCREPTSAELHVAHEILGPQLTESGVADLLWSVFMLPEFQLVR